MRALKISRFLSGVICCLKNTGNKSPFRTNWWWVSQSFHTAFLRGFLTVTTAAFGEQRTLMLHLFTATKMFCGQCLGDYCAWLFNWLSAQIYWVFPVEMLPELLEEILLALRGNMWLQHDGVAGHWARQVPEYLTANYKDRWIGRAGSVAWPSRSPGLILLDFSQRCYMKTSTYSSSDDFEEAAAPTRHNPGVYDGTRQFLLRRFRLWIEADEITFEYLL